jgi:hypothetical protein
MESLATQVFVIYIIHSKYFTLKSLPSFAVILGTFSVVIFGWIFPYLTIGKYFYFEFLPYNILKVIIAILLGYLLFVELVKIIFYNKFKK